MLKKDDYDGLIAYMNYKGFDYISKYQNIESKDEIIIINISFRKINKLQFHKSVIYPYDDLTIKVTEFNNKHIYSILEQVYSEKDKSYLIKNHLDEIKNKEWNYFKFYDISPDIEIDVNNIKWKNILNPTVGNRLNHLSSYPKPINGFIDILLDNTSPEHAALFLKKLDSSNNYEDSTGASFVSEKSEQKIIFDIFHKIKYYNSPEFVAHNILFSTFYIDKKYNVKFGQKTATIPLLKRNKINYISIIVGDIKLLYVLDTGASDMSIPRNLFQKLMNLKIIDNSNLLPNAKYQIADGTIIERKRFILPIAQIGGIKVENIVCDVVSDAEPLLLGKSFLDKFKSFKIITSTNMLELESF